MSEGRQMLNDYLSIPDNHVTFYGVAFNPSYGVQLPTSKDIESEYRNIMKAKIGGKKDEYLSEENNLANWLDDESSTGNLRTSLEKFGTVEVKIDKETKGFKVGRARSTATGTVIDNYDITSRHDISFANHTEAKKFAAKALIKAYEEKKRK